MEETELELYCLHCGHPQRVGSFACPAVLLDGSRCWGPDFVDVLPGNVVGYQVSGTLLGLLGRLVELPRAHVLLIYGEAGSGKSTVALGAFENHHVGCSEMDPALTTAYGRRLGAKIGTAAWLGKGPGGELDLRVPYHPLHGWPDLLIDSANGTGNSLGALVAARRYARRTACRAIVTAHVTKEGDVRGSAELLHEADIVVELTDRYIRARKSRFGPERTMHVRRGADGRIDVPIFDRYYSVEGRGAALRLCPHPTRRARYADVLRRAKALELKLPPAPAAVAASYAPLYDDGWIEPEDVEQRIAFAHSHAMPYYSPVRGLLEVPIVESDNP